MTRPISKFLGKPAKRDVQIFARVPRYFKKHLLNYIKDKYDSQSDYIVNLVLDDMRKHNALPED